MLLVEEIILCGLLNFQILFNVIFIVGPNETNYVKHDHQQMPNAQLGCAI